MNEAIKQILMSKGWEGILKILKEVKDDSLSSIPTNQTDREIATQYVGRIEAQSIINKLLKKLDELVDDPKKPPTKYV